MEIRKIEKIVAKKVKNILKDIAKRQKKNRNFLWMPSCSLNVKERLEALGYTVERVDVNYSRISW